MLRAIDGTASTPMGQCSQKERQSPLIRTCLLAMAFMCWAVSFKALRAETPALPPFTWGDTTHVADAGWGRMIRLHGQDWLCVDNLYPKPNAVWQPEISHDNARTWTPVTTVGETGRNLDNGELIQLPNKTLLLTGRSVVTSGTPGVQQSYHLPVYQSTDEGKTWTFLSQVATSEPNPNPPHQPSQGLWEPHFFLLPDGALACAYADETLSVSTPAFSQIVSEKVSRDGGATWGPKIVLAAQIGGGGQRPGMPVVTRMKNGQYAAVYEVVGIGDANVYFKTSRDGVSWPSGIGTPIPCQHAGPWITSLLSGRLVVSSCENQISYSDDYGATWLLSAPSAKAFGHVFSWPAIYEAAPNQLALMTSWHGVQIRWGQVSPSPTWPAAFAYDFAGASDAGWTRYGGNYAFADGAYLLLNAGTTGKTLTGNPAWGDGTVQADVMLTSAGNAGVMVRTTNADLAGPDSFFGYYVGLESSGSVFLSRSVDDYTQLDRTPMPVALNTWYPVKVVMHGATLTVFVGDMKTPKMKVSDSYLSRGQIGLRAHLCNAEFNHVRYQAAAVTAEKKDR